MSPDEWWHHKWYLTVVAIRTRKYVSGYVPYVHGIAVLEHGHTPRLFKTLKEAQQECMKHAPYHWRMSE